MSKLEMPYSIEKAYEMYEDEIADLIYENPMLSVEDAVRIILKEKEKQGS